MGFHIDIAYETSTAVWWSSSSCFIGSSLEIHTGLEKKNKNLFAIWNLQLTTLTTLHVYLYMWK